MNLELIQQIKRRRTFAIISHPDAGKTTVTEQLLLYGGAIQMAGTVKSRKSSRHATSDWMRMEKERGISITSSVMQLEYNSHIINLLDTPGHADFSEDTYRTLTAVDSAMMVIDVAKGVESRAVKLMEVCHLRNTPIITFINKLDREGKEAIDLFDEIESELKIKCVPFTWPIGMGSRLIGIYNLLNDTIRLYKKNEDKIHPYIIDKLQSNEAKNVLGVQWEQLNEEIELIRGVYGEFDEDSFLLGKSTPVFFGTALHNFGVSEFLDCLVERAPSPLSRITREREVKPTENKFSGFVFKIQANMDPAHRDRIGFLRICSGCYKSGMKMRHVRTKKELQISNALTFMAGSRKITEEAWPGDVIGLHNHGTIQVGDTFTQGETLNFKGIPHFAPELFKRIKLGDPLKMKSLQKGLLQLGEEGVAQIFRPINSNDMILGAIGVLQFDVVVWRLKEEYGINCSYDNIPIAAARWIECEDNVILDEFRKKIPENIAIDGGGNLTYLAPSMVNLNLTIERWEKIKFHSTREF